MERRKADESGIARRGRRGGGESCRNYFKRERERKRERELLE